MFVNTYSMLHFTVAVIHTFRGECFRREFGKLGEIRSLITQHVNTYISIIGTVSAKNAPRLKCYKNASRLNRYNFPTDNAIDFLFSTLHRKMV